MDIKMPWINKIPKKAIIIACDFVNKKELFQFLSKFGKQQLFLKLGMEIIYAEGPELIQELKNLGHFIFLDLKLFDIPNTVNKAIKSLIKYPFDLLTIHGSGSQQMLDDAVIAAGKKHQIIAVSALTSFSIEEFQASYLTNKTPLDFAKNICLKIQNAKGAGIVCSVQEAKILKPLFKNLIFICPGIRDIKNSLANDDQGRIATTIDAKNANIDYIVVGRPIIHATNPYDVYQNFYKEFIG